MPNSTPLEEVEQEILVNWLEANGFKFTAVPNSTYTKSWKQKAKNKRTGLRPGFPDMIVLTHVGMLCIELKRKKGSTTSPEQTEWVDAINATPGVQAEICYGADEAIAFIKRLTS